MSERVGSLSLSLCHARCSTHARRGAARGSLTALRDRDKDKIASLIQYLKQQRNVKVRIFQNLNKLQLWTDEADRAESDFFNKIIRDTKRNNWNHITRERRARL